jgi:small subunit ribosomal protein S18
MPKARSSSTIHQWKKTTSPFKKLNKLTTDQGEISWKTGIQQTQHAKKPPPRAVSGENAVSAANIAASVASEENIANIAVIIAASMGRATGKRNSSEKSFASFAQKKIKVLDYKNTDLLRRFITEHGKILPRRITGTCAKHQRLLSTAINRARIVALLPFTDR